MRRDDASSDARAGVPGGRTSYVRPMRAAAGLVSRGDGVVAAAVGDSDVVLLAMSAELAEVGRVREQLVYVALSHGALYAICSTFGRAVERCEEDNGGALGMWRRYVAKSDGNIRWWATLASERDAGSGEELVREYWIEERPLDTREAGQGE